MRPGLRTCRVCVIIRETRPTDLPGLKPRPTCGDPAYRPAGAEARPTCREPAYGPSGADAPAHGRRPGLRSGRELEDAAELVAINQGRAGCLDKPLRCLRRMALVDDDVADLPA